LGDPFDHDADVDLLMATTIQMRRPYDLRRWELCASLPTPAYVSVTSPMSTLFDQYMVIWRAVTAQYAIYDPIQDAFRPMAAPPGSYTDGSYGFAYHPSGPTGTASAGSATTISTTTNLPGSIAGYTVRITAGTGAGQERMVSSNTTGSNAVLTVPAWSVTPDSTSVYLLLTGRFWVCQGQATASLYYYDVATNTWSAALSMAGVTAASGQWNLTSTPAFGNTIASGTATSGSATTLVNSAKNWATNQWANYQVRITAGTGAGKVATITSNTATTLSFATVGVTLGSTSQYVLEPNDDFLYLTGSAVALYRYSISGNSWSTLSPGVARTSAPGTGSNLSWVAVASDPSWADETSIKNGRYLYSFGAAVSTLAIYDIAANTWNNIQSAYQGSGSLFPVNNIQYSYAVDREWIYIINWGNSSSVASNVFRFNCVTNTLGAFSAFPFLGNSATPSAGLKSGIVTYSDGDTVVRWLYSLMPNAPAMARIMI
jgi:hypothetical protein